MNEDDRHLRALRDLADGTRGARSRDECLTLAARALEDVHVRAWFFACDGSGAPRFVAGADAPPPAIAGALAEAMSTGHAARLDETTVVLASGPTAALAIAAAGEEDAAFHELLASMLASAIASATAHVRADEAHEELETFTYSLAHDLRAPLRALDGFSRILATDYGDKLDDEGRHHLDRIRAGTHRMAQLIDDLLGLARITRHQLAHERLDLSTIARTVVTTLEAADPARKVECTVAEDLAGDGDPRLVLVLFENLLGNAWKFSSKRPDARIEVGREVRSCEHVFYVRDNGAGFSMEYASKLFTPFQRLHSAAEFPGKGVGLAAVRRVVTRHGGRIWAQSTPEKGATFFFTLGAPR